MTREDFLCSQNVIVFEHLVVGQEIARAIERLIAHPFDDQIKEDAEHKLATLVREKIDKYNTPELKRHIKLIYLFLIEGIEGMAAGRALPEQLEAKIKEMFEAMHFPSLKVIGIRELLPIFAQVEARVPGIGLAAFLLKKDGRGGYDSPKIAAALIQLARRDYERQEMFIRIDDDVKPNAAGIQELKGKYYDLVHEQANRYFCMSWNYESLPLKRLLTRAASEATYEELFRHYVNTYAIRITFLGEPASRCDYDPDSRKLVSLQPAEDACRLNLVHTKYFIDLFQKGRWGSNLRDPISGAGMCFSADALVELPPWCNADELITWIDDFVKWQLMAVYFGERFANEVGLLKSRQSPGFEQNRKDPAQFTHGDIEWSTNTYLDRLVMGCIMSYCVDPARFGDSRKGFGNVLKEPDYLTALRRWRGEMATNLRDGATAHIRQVLQDWHHFFCRKSAPSSARYLNEPPPPPAGFVPAPATTFFNAYTLKQLLAIDQDKFDLVSRVLEVLGRYLDMKYRFWPHVVGTIEELRTHRRRPQAVGAPQEQEDPNSWLFADLDKVGPPEPRPAERISSACIALIRDPASNGDARWLMQWNSKWEEMNFVAGHCEERDPTELAYMMRELHEELFQDLSQTELAEMYAALGEAKEYTKGSSTKWNDEFIESVAKSENSPDDFTEYVEFSRSAGVWSQYRLKVYSVRLTSAGQSHLFRANPLLPGVPGGRPEGPNEWVSRRDIEAGWTKMGRPISRTAFRFFEETLL